MSRLKECLSIDTEKPPGIPLPCRQAFPLGKHIPRRAQSHRKKDQTKLSRSPTTSLKSSSSIDALAETQGKQPSRRSSIFRLEPKMNQPGPISNTKSSFEIGRVRLLHFNKFRIKLDTRTKNYLYFLLPHPSAWTYKNQQILDLFLDHHLTRSLRDQTNPLQDLTPCTTNFGRASRQQLKERVLICQTKAPLWLADMSFLRCSEIA